MPIPAQFERFLNQDGKIKIKDYCEILGIRTPFNDDDVKNAYRRLAKECHPDRNGNSSYSITVFQAISDAKDKISCPSTRDAYLESLLVPRAGRTGVGTSADRVSATYDLESAASRASAATAPSVRTPFSFYSATTPLVKLPCVISITKTHGSLNNYNAIFRDSSVVVPLKLVTRIACSGLSLPFTGPLATFSRAVDINLTSRKRVHFYLHEYNTISELALRKIHGAEDKVVFITGELRHSDADRRSIESVIRECQIIYSSHDLYTLHLDGDDNIQLEPFSRESFERAYAEKPVTISNADILGHKLLKLVGDFVEQSILSSNPAPNVAYSFFSSIFSSIRRGVAASLPAPEWSIP